MCRSPKWAANRACCCGVIGWSRKNSTWCLSNACSMASRCSRFRGWLMSMPLICAPRAELKGVMDRWLMVVLFNSVRQILWERLSNKFSVRLAVPRHEFALQGAQAHFHGEGDQRDHQNPQHHHIGDQELRR